MKINTKIRYSLRMLAFLAENTGVVNTEILGEKMMVSPKYLRKLAGPMERAQIISSVQGKYGGYRLNRKPEEILISDIFNAYNESLEVSGCTRQSGCILADDCVLSGLWEYFEKMITGKFLSVSLKDVMTGNFKD